jgi:hypothetical protein
MTRAERFSEIARRWFIRDETGLSVDRFLDAVGKRASLEATHITQGDGAPRIGFMAWLIPFSDGSYAAMFMRVGEAPVIADIEPDQFDPALHYAAKLLSKVNEASDEMEHATIH